MKRQIILFLVFVFSCIASLNAQELITERQTPATDQLQQRIGEVVDYQKVLRRFETAIKENDASSITDLQQDLVSAMQKRIALLETENSTGKKHQAELIEQQEILKTSESFDFTKMTTEQTATMEQLKKLQRFAHLMADNYELK